MNRRWIIGVAAVTLGIGTGTGTGFAKDPVFLEADGIVAIEAESTRSRLGDWEK